MKSNINFAFIRHGFGCHNAISGLHKSELISVEDAMIFSGKRNEINKNAMVDPVLTQVGVDASIHNGCVMNQIFRSIDSIIQNNYGDTINMDKINVIGCSPLIRCMETAYYMSRSWPNPPSKIYVFPFLREIDESSDNKYSLASIIRMNKKPFYAMKSIEEQKKYLESLGILNFFDFSFVEMFKKERAEPGDIETFTRWFVAYFFQKKGSLPSNDSFVKGSLPSNDSFVKGSLPSNDSFVKGSLFSNDSFVKGTLSQTQDLPEKLNVFIVTHAGVLSDFAVDDEGFVNNSGFIINTIYNKTTGIMSIKKYITLNPFLEFFNFYQDYKNINMKEYYCPSNRCGNLCSVMKDKEQKDDKGDLKHINVTCDINKKIDIPSLLKILNLN